MKPVVFGEKTARKLLSIANARDTGTDVEGAKRVRQRTIDVYPVAVRVLTITDPVTAGNNRVVPVSNTEGLLVGATLRFASEDVVIEAVGATTFTADFVNSHADNATFTVLLDDRWLGDRFDFDAEDNSLESVEVLWLFAANITPVAGTYYDGMRAGVAEDLQVWLVLDVSGGGGSGITSINSQTGPAITHAVGTSGSNHNIAASGNTITHNIPDASISARGLVTTGAQTFEGLKDFQQFVTAPWYAIDGGPLQGSVSLGNLTPGLIGSQTVGLLATFTAGGNDYVANFAVANNVCYMLTTVNGTLASTAYGVYDATIPGIVNGVSGVALYGANVRGGLVVSLGFPISINLATQVTGTLPIANGGTGAATFTNHGILLGQGSSAIVATAVMSNGQILVGSTGADPVPRTMSGDATLAASGALTIANEAVSYAKMQNVSAASKLLGRGDSGAGDPEEITLGSGLTMTGTTLDASSGVSIGQAVSGGTANFVLFLDGSSQLAQAATLPMSMGGTGANLSAPAADQILAWDDIDGTMVFWALGTGLSYDHGTHTLSATATAGNVVYSTASPSAGADYDGWIQWSVVNGINQGLIFEHASTWNQVGWIVPSGGAGVGFIMIVGVSNEPAWSQFVPATSVSYSATTPTDWNGSPPSDVNAAIDRCATLLKALNGGTGP